MNMDRIRRVFNLIEAFFDRKAMINTVRFQRAAALAATAVTAEPALSACLPIAREYDPAARLMLIVAAGGCLQSDGTSTRWESFFDLPARRAQMICTWFLPWSEASDAWQDAQIDVVIQPFPPPGSLPRQLVRNGKLLHRQLASMWRQECQRRAPLPTRFLDSDQAIRELVRQGLNVDSVDLALKAECGTDGRARWSASTRGRTFEVSF